MEMAIIVLITLIFACIFFNLLTNKKFSIVSTVLFMIVPSFYLIKGLFNDLYLNVIKTFPKIEIFILVYCIIIFGISILEYVIAYKKNSNLIIEKEQNIEDKNIKNTIEDIDTLMVYLEMIEEPLACLVGDKYVINNKMKKLLKDESYYIEKRKLYSYIHTTDKNNFFNSNSSCIFRMKIDGDYLWFEGFFVIIKGVKYCLIKKHNESSNNKLKIRSFKELNYELREYENKNKDYYLVFFDLINLKEILSFYGNDFLNIVVSKHLSKICDLSYINDFNLFYINQNEYVILLDNLLEYNILLSELESNMSILIKDEIKISENKIIISGKIGTIASSNVKDKKYNNVINKGFEMVKLACKDDYPLDYAIFHELDESIDYSLRDLNIDLDINLEDYKKRIQ